MLKILYNRVDIKEAALLLNRRKEAKMTSTELRERIAKAEERIEKKEATIAKKQEWIEKKTAKLASMTESDRRWAEFDILHWNEDIERASKEIPEIRKTIAKYEAQLKGEAEADEILREIPENMKRMQTELVDRWNEFDLKRRETIRADHKAMTYRDFHSKYNRSECELMYKTDDEIDRENKRDAKALILDLIRRVKAITGEITDWSGIRAEVGTWGFTVLNGVVIGKTGKCIVESILAGGYNIQRLHVRVLTKEVA